MKNCIICGDLKPLTDYYVHKQMNDGHLNKCKTCCKQQADEREKRLRNNPEWVEKEKERAREKYHRLNYRDKHKPTKENKKKYMDKYKENYPEKKKANNKCANLAPLVLGNELHHWSYNEEHFTDVIELSVNDHYLIHRHMRYSNGHKMYIDKKGHLLNTKQSHIDLLKSLHEKQVQQ
jgi:hypothetical protein